MRGRHVAVLVTPDRAGELPLELIEPHAEIHVASSLEELREALAVSDVLFATDFRSTLLRRAWPRADRLRWIHAGSVGVDAVLIDEVVRSDVTVTNTRGVFERPIAEYILGALLVLAKDMRRTFDLQAQHVWEHRPTHSLRNRRMLLLGAGAIAREIAQLASAIGMSVDAVGRTRRDGDADFGCVHGAEELDELLGRADVVVAALPLTAQTRSLLDARRIARMRPGAWLVNVGRGALIDENALLEALRDRQIGAAVLDVFETEPLPREHPFWDMEQVIVSPHMSADLVGWPAMVVDRFLANLRRWQAGESLADVVDKGSFRAPPEKVA